MCGRSDSLCRGGVQILKGFSILLAINVYQFLCFSAFVSLSIGIAVVSNRVYEYFMGAEFPAYLEAYASIYLVSVFAEFHIFCQQECLGTTLRSYYRLYPHLLPLGTVFIYTILYMVAFAELYVQFESVHLIRKPLANGHDGVGSAWEMSHLDEVEVADIGMSSKDQIHTFFFLLALTYIVYCTMKIVHQDTIEQIKRITNPSSCIHCMITMGFMMVHFLMDILYSIPLAIVAFSLRMYKYGGPMTFVQLNLVAVLSGMVFAVIETRRPWPTVRSQPPFFAYENNSRAKNLLGQLNVILILIYFYNSNDNGKIPDANYNAANNHVLFFSFAVAFNVLHFAKMLVFIALQKDPPADDITDEQMEDVERAIAIAVVNAINQEGSPQELDPDAIEPQKKPSSTNNNEGENHNDLNMNYGGAVWIAGSRTVFLPEAEHHVSFEVETEVPPEDASEPRDPQKRFRQAFASLEKIECTVNTMQEDLVRDYQFIGKLENAILEAKGIPVSNSTSTQTDLDKNQNQKIEIVDEALIIDKPSEIEVGEDCLEINNNVDPKEDIALATSLIENID